jgi:hypothetical protein
MPNPNDPLIVKMLEARAQANAVNGHTGYATSDYNIGVRYYPACGRYAWYGEYGPINKQHAVELLRAAMRWKAPA